MAPRATLLERLRSRVTGTPAEAYATRRLAREDLHALVEQRARMVARVQEDIDILDRLIDPLDRYTDGDRVFVPLGTLNDRRSGKNLPLVWTELDLREFRRLSRLLCDTNPFAVGFLSHLVNFHIRKGMGWQACLRGAKKGAYDTGTDGAAVDPAVRRCQVVLDEFRDHARWPFVAREGFRRRCRDGEVFLRFFRGGADTRGLPRVRFVEPEQVGPPPGSDGDGRWSFGVLTDPRDAQSVHAYWVRDPLGTGTEGEEVPADRVLHLKANVDSCVKRGLPDFLPVQGLLDDVRKLLRNMGAVAAVQAAIAWVNQYATATLEQVTTLIRSGSDYSTPKIGSTSTRQTENVKYEPGTVLHMDSGRQFVAGPVAQGTAGFLQVEQALLRGAGARWGMPEYFSGDASNNNFASSLVAGAPFVVAIEGGQFEWADYERRAALKVLALAAEAGRLARADVERVDVEVEPPAVALQDKDKDTGRRLQLVSGGVMSKTTAQQQEGLDPKHEAANMAAEKKADGGSEDGGGGPGGGPGGGGPPPDGNGGGGTDGGGDNGGGDLAALLGESVEWVSEAAYALLSEAGREGLVQKTIKVKGKGGKEYDRKVWVKPEQPKADKPAAKKADAKVKAKGAVTALVAKLKAGESPGADELAAMPGHLASMTVPEITALKKELGLKGGRTKNDHVEKLLAHAKAKAGGATDPGAKPEPAAAKPKPKPKAKADEAPAGPEVPTTPTVHPPGSFDGSDRFDKTGKYAADAAVTYPAGYLPPKAREGRPADNVPNSHCPQESRPALTADEARAVEEYSGSAYGPLNKSLRETGGPPADHAGTHAALQAAFARAKPFPEPVQVVRGLSLHGDDRKKFLAAVTEAQQNGSVATMPGYLSTSATGGRGGFSGNVRLHIAATHGIDAQPYANVPTERELILNHGSKFRVAKVERDGLAGDWHVHLEQIPPDQGSA